MRLKYVNRSWLILAVLLIGCAAKQLGQGAEKIIVTPQAAPASCKFLGTVIGSQGNFFTGAWTSNKHLAEGALNDMRNRALELGANYVVLATHTAGVTGSASSYGGSQQQTDVTQTGAAYSCPPADIGL
jgi:uncharacterized protein YbjQ (UPF0145 family)